MIIQAVIILFAAIAAWRAFRKYRSKDITAGWLAVWLLFWIAVSAAAVIPKKTDVAAAWFGVERGADLATYLSIVLLFYLAFRIFIKIQSIEKNITKITREIAVGEKSEDAKKHE
ncbi:MAG: DUF2304 domain-containing protein [Patescibacteria group bacterium]|nr:DUF2304 domain-containing protein [Patescibacteria group bacterium]